MPSYTVRILSAPSATGRRNRVATMMDGMTVEDWRFFDVLPASEVQVPYDDIAAFRAYGSILSPAEVSCAASHIGIMKSFLATSEADYLIVMEDDVFVDPMYDLAQTAVFMSATKLDYLKLYARYFVPARYVAGIERLNVYRASWSPLGTQCYVLSRGGARKMLDSILTRRILSYPIDVLLDRFWETGLPIVLHYPFPVMELAVPTTIHGPASRARIAESNALLKTTVGTMPHRIRRTIDNIARKRADQRLKQFDADLRGSIERVRVELEPKTIVDRPMVAVSAE